MDWESKLNIFLETFQHKKDIIGILVCGSYITGNTTSHSDLDVHIILDDKVDYRERGNKIIDNLLIEYFANPPKQIRDYFKSDYENIRPMSQTQFITGKILYDKTGEVKKLKEEAKSMLNNHYKEINTNINELEKYNLWDMLDDLEDTIEKEDFNFNYYCNLDKLISVYMKYIKLPYNKKTILGNIESKTVRDKYLLEELPDKEIKELIKKCITISNKKERLNNYRLLTNKVFNLTGRFNIDNFKFKSKVDIK